MDIYVLDSALRRIACVDVYISFIWAERYSEDGDFVLTLDYYSKFRSLFKKGAKLVIVESFKVMTVDTVESGLDSSGARVVKVTGYSEESIFRNRLAKKNSDNLTLNPDWQLEGTPREVLKEMVYAICLTGVLSTHDIIPYLVPGDFIGVPGTWLGLPDTLYWDDAVGEWISAYTGATNEEVFDEIIANIKPKPLYDAIKDICDVFDIGFRLVRNYDNSELYFEVYTGQDRSSQQTFYPVMRFSSDMDNLVSSSEVDTENGSYNVAYVYSKLSHVVVYPEGIDETTATGFGRRVCYVEVTDEDEEMTLQEHERVLVQRGQEELAKHRATVAFDGEIGKKVGYTYGKDYNLGDIVEVKNANGVISLMRVSEQIFSNDADGVRSYPTLTNISTINPKTWRGQPPALYWSAAEGYWIDW